ncbi:hypothetical protein [Desulfuribacillus stibiiarsenatis]|nr:hypothetical protein [Desulfuribacillus stibiiarsenatis]
MFKENQINERFIQAERSIKSATESYQAGDLDTALFHLEMADEIYPNYYQVYLLRADWLWESDRHLESVVAYHQALRINYHWERAYERIITFYENQGMYNEANRYRELLADLVPEEQETTTTSEDKLPSYIETESENLFQQKEIRREEI